MDGPWGEGLRDAPEVLELAQRLTEGPDTQDPIEDVYPLSPVQEGMLFESLASDAVDLYLVQQRIRIDGPLEIDALRRAWAHVLDRHPALRTAFLSRGHERPVQVVCRGVSIDLDVHDLTGAAGADARIAAHMRQDQGRAFDPRRPPLIRVSLFRLGPGRHEMLLSQSHLLQDGWSSTNVLGELFAAHDAFAAGEAPDLPSVRPVREFIEWLEARDRRLTRAFWRGQLEGLDTPTRMTGADGAADTGAFERRFRSLEERLTEELRATARSQRISLSALVAGAIALLIGRYNDSSDVAFCIVAAGRPPTLPGIESMVGMFINTLPLRIPIDEGATLDAWLRDVHTRQAALLEHEHSPLAEVQSWSDLDPGVRLTDTLVAFGSYPAGSVTDTGLAYRTVDGFGRPGFPLSITVEASDPLKVGLHFAATDLDPESADRLIDHLTSILRCFVRDPGARVGSVRMLDDDELRALTSSGSTAPIDAPTSCFPDLFAEQVARTPHASALIFGEDELTYEQVDKESSRLAHHLRALGVEREVRVAVCLDRSLDLVVALIAVHKAGGAFVPLDPALPPERLAYMVGDSGAAAMVTVTPILERLFPDWQGPVAALDGDRAAHSERPPDRPEVAVGSTDLAYVIYTSGSTGTPKGVEIEHGALANFLTSMRERPGLQADDVLLAVTTPSFDIAMLELFLPLIVGATIVIADDATARDGWALAEALEERGVTVMQTTPTRWRSLLTSGWTGSDRLSVLCGGEPLSRELANRLRVGNRALWNLYGPTETTIWSSAGQVTDDSGAVTIGAPIANTRLYVLDKHLRPVPKGVVGTLYIGGTGLARGYHGRPDQTAARFLSDPFVSGERIYDTGDLARRTDAGIEILGRTDAQVKLRGHRIELGEVESAIASHPLVTASAATIITHGPEDHRLVGYYVVDSGVVAGHEEVRAHLGRWLPNHMIPQHLVQVDGLPSTPGGKLDRKRLPEPVLQRIAAGHQRGPMTESERVVIDACNALLGRDDVGLDDNFVDLGGHSLLSMRLVTLLRDQTGVRIDPRFLMLNDLGQVAARLESGSAAAANPAATSERTVTDGGSRAPPMLGTYFESASASLLGVHHAPSDERGRGALLLCGAVGWEYTHAHRALRGLARRAARAGLHVLRFDYRGTGDSSGGAEDLSVDGWIDDIVAAERELKRRSGADGVSIVGLRLGAALAATAMARARVHVRRLILWDPVVAGADFLEAQVRLHGKFLRWRVEGLRTAPVPSSSLVDGELLGQAYPAELREQLGRVDLRRVDFTGVPTSLLASEANDPHRRLVEGADGAVAYELLEDAGGWEEPEARNALVIPSRIPERIVALVSAGP